MLADLTLKTFLEKTASDSPFPGGGSMAALSAAASASLIEMVANVTIGKKGYAEVGTLMKAFRDAASAYRNKSLQNIDRDSDAYQQVVSAFRLPKNTEQEKKIRGEAIQNALKHASLVPLEIAKDAFCLMELAEKVIEQGNKNALTDGFVAAMMAKTAVLSALCNVKINLTSLKDKDFAKEIAEQVRYLENSVKTYGVFGTP